MTKNRNLKKWHWERSATEIARETTTPKGQTGFDDAEEGGDVLADVAEHLLLRQLKRLVIGIAVRAVVDNAVHVQIQVVKVRHLRMSAAQECVKIRAMGMGMRMGNY